MKSLIRTSLVFASLLALVSTVGYAQNRPPCEDAEGNPLYSEPGACFWDSGLGLWASDFQKYGFFYEDEVVGFQRSTVDGLFFWHVQDKSAKAIICDPVFAPGCEGRFDDFNAPDFAFPGELVGTARLTMNGACYGTEDGACGIWCPATMLITGEVFSESGAAHDFTYSAVLAPANDPNHFNLGKCKIVSLDFTVE